MSKVKLIRVAKQPNDFYKYGCGIFMSCDFLRVAGDYDFSLDVDKNPTPDCDEAVARMEDEELSKYHFAFTCEDQMAIWFPRFMLRGFKERNNKKIIIEVDNKDLIYGTNQVLFKNGTVIGVEELI